MNNNTTRPLVAQPATGVAPRREWQGVVMRQMVGLLRDCSGSMSHEQKASDATQASADLSTTLADPVNRDGFDLCIVDFDTAAQCLQPFERATVVCNQIPPISPNGWTSITIGIEEMYRQMALAEAAKGAQELSRYLRPVVILFTDGGHNTGPDPRPAASILKQKADLVTAAFGSDADQALLKDLATSPQHFYALKDGRALRNFLATVGVTVSYTRLYGKPATNALANMRRTP